MLQQKSKKIPLVMLFNNMKFCLITFRKGFGATLVRRVRKAGSDIMNKVPSRVMQNVKLLWVIKRFNNIILYRIEDLGTRIQVD